MTSVVGVTGPGVGGHVRVLPRQGCLWGGGGHCDRPARWEARHDGSDVPTRLCENHIVRYFEADYFAADGLMPINSVIRIQHQH